MNIQAVLDASALLAFLQDESGSKKVDNVLEQACISSVNWSEVVKKAIAAGVDPEGSRQELEALGLLIYDFTAEQAETAGRLWEQTKTHGLSLGDRACLSLGITLGIPVWSTDKVWKKLKLPVKINVIR